MRDIATTYGKNNILVTRFVAVIDIVASANHYAMPPPPRDRHHSTISVKKQQISEYERVAINGVSFARFL